MSLHRERENSSAQFTQLKLITVISLKVQKGKYKPPAKESYSVSVTILIGTKTNDVYKSKSHKTFLISEVIVYIVLMVRMTAFGSAISSAWFLLMAVPLLPLRTVWSVNKKILVMKLLSDAKVVKSYKLVLKDVHSLLGDCRKKFDDEYERETNQSCGLLEVQKRALNSLKRLWEALCNCICKMVENHIPQPKLNPW